jgi:hypothetical protein
MAKTSKRFRIATEGATVDGRVIERSWIEQMAANYDPAKYRAGINIEHIRSALPDSPFKNYGFVDTLSSEENGSKKLELFATISPSNDLIKLTKGYQKVFTSIEVNEDFADTKEAYLVGLAVTDSPASLGTEMLAFTAQNPNASPLTGRKQQPTNYFTVAMETDIEFIDADTSPSILDKVRAIFAKQNKTDDARFNDIATALAEIAEHGQTQSTQSAEQLQHVDASMAQLKSRLQALETQFNTTQAPGQTRPLATGQPEMLTDF